VIARASHPYHDRGNRGFQRRGIRWREESSTLRQVQRFFSTFPGRGPGAGLFLLRTVAGGVTALHGGLYLTQAADPKAMVWALGLLAVVSGAALVAGFLTPGAAVAASAATLLLAALWTPPSVPMLHLDGAAALLVAVDAIALALLGPGAHSIDAHLFGRREIIISPDSLPHKR